MKILSGKIPISISPSFWILAFLIAWLSSSGSPWQFVSWICIVFLSVLVHEMGHALVAKMWGQNVQIILGPLGGTTIYGQSKTPLSRIKEFTVVLCGPLFGFLLAAFCYLFLKSTNPTPNVTYFLYFMMFANIVWSFFNLLPVHPFDGGKLMSLVFEGVFGPAGMRFSYLLSGIFAVVLTAVFMINGQIFAGALLLLCAFESFKNFQQKRYFQTTATEQQVDELKQIEDEWNQNKPDTAIEHLQQLMQKTKEGAVYSQALELQAEYLAATGKTQKAYDLLHNQKNLSADALKLLQLVCYKLGYYQEALDTGNNLFRQTQDPSCAIMNAFCASHLDDAHMAVNWLSTVKKAKAVDMQAVLAAADFDSIRKHPDFQQFVLTKPL